MELLSQNYRKFFTVDKFFKHRGNNFLRVEYYDSAKNPIFHVWYKNSGEKYFQKREEPPEPILSIDKMLELEVAYFAKDYEYGQQKGD